jgi:2,3-bisphosphoglycerate-independent phosphoglycerate mutase
VDDAGHDRDPALKAAWLGAVDAMVGRLVGRLAGGVGGGGEGADPARPPFILAVTGDHSTPAVFGDHSVEPVPFAAAPVGPLAAALGGATALEGRYGGVGRLEPVPLGPAGGAPPRPPPPATFPPPPAFDEAAAAAGSLGRFPGREVMPLLARMAREWGGV